MRRRPDGASPSCPASRRRGSRGPARTPALTPASDPWKCSIDVGAVLAGARIALDAHAEVLRRAGDQRPRRSVPTPSSLSCLPRRRVGGAGSHRHAALRRLLLEESSARAPEDTRTRTLTSADRTRRARWSGCSRGEEPDRAAARRPAQVDCTQETPVSAGSTWRNSAGSPNARSNDRSVRRGIRGIGRRSDHEIRKPRGLDEAVIVGRAARTGPADDACGHIFTRHGRIPVPPGWDSHDFLPGQARRRAPGPRAATRPARGLVAARPASG